MADKALEVQREVRAHTQMAVDFCRDLDNWESQISKVDEQLSKTKALKVCAEAWWSGGWPFMRQRGIHPAPGRGTLPQSQFPPPRSQRQQPEQQPPAAVPGDKATKATGGVRGKTKKKISGYDFRSWDKYDAVRHRAPASWCSDFSRSPNRYVISPSCGCLSAARCHL